MQPAGIEATLATDSQVAPIKPTESAVLTSLVTYIDGKMARTLPGLFVPDEFAHDPELALRRKLRSALQPLCFPDEDGRCAYLWPSSHLTDQDMGRLRIWGRLTGLPSNQLLHLSVTMMSEWLRLHLVQVLAKHEQSGIPFEMLLGGTPPNARRKRGRVWQSTADQADDAATAAIPKAPLIVLPAASTIDDLDPEPSACAAEPPPSAGVRSAAGRAASTSVATRRAERGSPPSEELVEQLRETCDEIRVLWQAVDELRESLEHTLRNVPEPHEPPRSPSIPEVESDVEDLLERLQQLPPALLADLQGRLATMNQPLQNTAPLPPLGIAYRSGCFDGRFTRVARFCFCA